LPFHAGHGGDGFFLIAAFEYEDGVNQIVCGQGVFAHQAAGKIVFAHTAHTGGGNMARREIHNRPF